MPLARNCGSTARRWSGSNPDLVADDTNLTGRWKGIFHYPRGLPPGQFDAELVEHAGTLTGETFEVSTNPRRLGQQEHAMIDGVRTGSLVRFIKHYDAFRRVRTPVHYDGTVSADGTEISGTWTIPGQWSGAFLMIRATPTGAEAERKVAEPVR